MRIQPREAVLAGNMRVRRILPYRARRMVGPFAFLDEMGPLTVASGQEGDVPPHPHIGLATVTYLFEGALVHRDSLGSVQTILPGELNWMTAGRGIVHSERLPQELRKSGGRLHGLQAWVALPLEAEETEPSFQHFGSDSLPRFEVDGCSMLLIAGQAYGHASPVRTHSRLFYLDARVPAGRRILFDPEGQEAALYLVSGEVRSGGEAIPAPVLLMFESGARVELEATQDARGLLLGGMPLEGPRTIWWNFVSSSREKIEDAKTRWQKQGFPPVPGETELVPLPGTSAAVDRSTLP